MPAINTSWPVCLDDFLKDIGPGVQRTDSRVKEKCVICGKETTDGYYYRLEYHGR